MVAPYYAGQETLIYTGFNLITVNPFASPDVEPVCPADYRSKGIYHTGPRRAVQEGTDEIGPWLSGRGGNVFLDFLKLFLRQCSESILKQFPFLSTEPWHVCKLSAAGIATHSA